MKVEGTERPRTTHYRCEWVPTNFWSMRGGNGGYGWHLLSFIDNDHEPWSYLPYFGRVVASKFGWLRELLNLALKWTFDSFTVTSKLDKTWKNLQQQETVGKGPLLLWNFCCIRDREIMLLFGSSCQSILWRLVLFKLGADYIAPMMQDLRIERHITWRDMTTLCPAVWSWLILWYDWVIRARHAEGGIRRI